MQVHRKNSRSIIDLLVWTGVLFLISASIPEASANTCYGTIDLILVVDASYSISDADFEVICKLSTSIFESVHADAGSKLRAGFIMYASTVYENDVMNLNAYNYNTFVTKVKGVTRNAMNIATSTGMALERALAMYKSQGGGNGKTTFVVLITDGMADDQLVAVAAANELKSFTDVYIAALGIGTNGMISPFQLNQIASPKLVFTKSILDVKTTSNNINQEFVNTIKGVVCEYTFTKRTDPEIPRDDIAMDVYFLLDESNTVQNQGFATVKQFMQSIMQTFVIDGDSAMVGVRKFGEQSFTALAHMIPINAHTSQSSLFNAINSMSLNIFNNGRRNVLSALSMLELDLAARGNSRPAIVVLVLTGSASDSTAAIQKAHELQANYKNMFMVVLGVGSDSQAWDSERNLFAYDVGTAFWTQNFAGISGATADSAAFIQRIRNTIKQLGLKQYQPQGPGVAQKWRETFDIVFLIDGSERMNPLTHFSITKYLLKELIDQFDLAVELQSGGGRVAVVIFDASGWYYALTFDMYSSRDQLYNLISNMKVIQRNKYADNSVGLRAMREYFAQHVREPAAQLGFLLTLSTSNNLLLAEAEAKQMALAGVQMIVVGVDSGVKADELNSLEVFVPNGGPVTLTALGSLASTEVLNELKTNIRTYAAINRPEGKYFPWSSRFDLIIMLHDNAGVTDSRAKIFLTDLLQRYQISPNEVRVGIITFGKIVNKGANQQIVLGSKPFLGELVLAILDLDLTPTGGANVQAVMMETQTMFNSMGRLGVPKLALLVMEGDVIFDDVRTVRDQLQTDGIFIASVGVGQSTSKVDMEVLAFNPELGFMMPNWGRVIITPPMDANIVALSRNQFTPSSIGDILRLPNVCANPASLLYLVDLSDSMLNIIDNTKKFAAALMSGFQMPTVKQGAIGFGTTVIQSTVIELNSFSTYLELYINFMSKMVPDSTSMGTGTFDAIQRGTNIFSSIVGEKIMIIFTDGKSDNPALTKTRAQEARNVGIGLVAIGVGSGIQQQDLLDISGSSDSIFQFENQDLLDVTKLQKVQEVVCTAIRPGECLSGNYRDPGMVCTPCPLGSYQDLPEQLFCVQCPTGQTTGNMGSTAASACTAQTQCPAGTFIQGADCTQCLYDSYQPLPGQTQCIPCPSDRPVTNILGATSISSCKTRVCPIPMDLVMVVDCSASIGQDFPILKMFLSNQLAKFDIGLGATQTRVSVVRLGDKTILPQHATLLSQSRDIAAVSTAIWALQGGAQTTNIASAIEVATQLLDKESTDPNKAKVIFIVTDSQSLNPFETYYRSILAKEKNYYVYVLVVGGVNPLPEMQRIASEANKVQSKTFDVLVNTDVTGEICRAATSWSSVVVVPDDPCNLLMDLVLIMDFSASSTLDPLGKVKLANFIMNLPLAPIKVNVGVIPFGDKVNDLILELSSDATTVTNFILARTLFSNPGTETAAALEAGLTMLLNRGRINAVKAMIVVTDGASTNHASTVQMSQKIRSQGVYAVCIGVGNVFVDEVRAIADTGSNSLIIRDNIQDVDVQEIVERTCPANFKCSYNLHVTFIWFIQGLTVYDKAKTFTKGLSDRFANILASVVDVSAVTDITAALAAAFDEMGRSVLKDTVHNIIIITDRAHGDIGNAIVLQQVAEAVQRAKDSGIKVTLIHGNPAADTGKLWEQYASSPKFAFYADDFTEKLTAWKIHRSLCKEPCVSGFEIKPSGECGMCGLGTYRDARASYRCMVCDLGASTSNPGSTSPLDCILQKCPKPMDLVLIVDNSDGILQAEFFKVQAFLSTLVNGFEIDQAKTRISLIEMAEPFDSRIFKLSESVNSVAVQGRILNIPEGASSKALTGQAVQAATTLFKQEGRNPNGFPPIIVSLLNGPSDSSFDTKYYSAKAQLGGAHMLSVGLGSAVLRDELNALASDPLKDKYESPPFSVDATDSAKRVQDSICQAASNYKPITPDNPSGSILGECQANMDMVIVLDASISIQSDTFMALKIFLNDFVSRLDVGPDKIRIGVVAFSDVVHTSNVFNLKDCVSMFDLLSLGIFNQIQKSNPGTNTADALRTTIEMFKTQGRQNSPYVAIVMTDGRSDNAVETANQANAAKDLGIHVVTIGYGNSLFTEELYVMATDANSVKIINNFADLTVKELLDLSCAFNFKCSLTMDVIALWDTQDFETIKRAQKFIENLGKSFSGSVLSNVFVHHVQHVGLAIKEAYETLAARPPSAAVTQAILIITDKDLTSTVKDSMKTWTDTAKNAGMIVAVVDSRKPTPNGIDELASNTKQSFQTNMFDMLPYSLVIQRSLCTGLCRRGNYINSQASGNCMECPVNTYNDQFNQLTCKPCPIGTTTRASGSDELTDCRPDWCDPGHQYDDPTDKCVPCGIGFFKTNNDMNCIRCPNGQTTYTNTATSGAACQAVCGVGNYIDVSSGACLPCPENTYNDKENQLKCIDCVPPKHTMGTGKDEESDCRLDWCGPGYQYDDPTNKCVPCGIGFYKTNNDIKCINCPNGQTTFTDTSTSGAACQAAGCGKGNFINVASQTCLPCPEDTYNDKENQVKCIDCVQPKHTMGTGKDEESDCRLDWCNPGYLYVDDLIDKCVPCGIGFYRTNNDMKCIQCPNGQTTYTNTATSAAACQAAACGKGNFINVASQTCLPCPEDTYNDKENQLKCIDCVRPKHTMGTGKDEESDCRLDWCNPGYLYVDDLIDKCVPCGIGFYRTNNDMKCIQCPNGQTTYTNTATSAAACQAAACGKGNFINVASQTCLPCPEDTYNDKENQLKCIDCVPPKHTMGTGKDEESDCRLDWCDAGYLYVDETNACVPCGIGFYRTDHDMECIRCPNGLTTLTPTATSAAACTAAACGKGNFINVASQTCLPCPEDTYNDKENQLKCIDCVPPKHTMGTGKDEESDCRLDWCDAGYLYVDETNACVPCGIGFYRTDHDMECIRCPNGLTTLTPTATSAAACTGSGAVNAFGLTMDLLVVTDLSASTTSAGLASVRTFLSEMVSRMSVNNRYTHVGNMAYARGVSTLMTLESGQFPDRVLRSLNSGFRISPFREVNTGFALHQACKVFTSYCRRHVEKRLLLITDEISSDTGLSRIQSEKLKAKGVRIIVIGSDVTEANQLASGPQYVFKINSYTNMPSLDAVLVAFK